MSNIETSTDIKQLMGALGRAHLKLHGVARDSVNPHFKNRYASLEAVISAVKEPLLEQGIIFTQALGRVTANALEIDTMLVHIESTQWMRSTMHVPLSKLDPQGAGSAGTYGARYSLMAILGLPPIDDDAESAIDRSDSPPKPITRPQALPKTTQATTLAAAEQIASLGVSSLQTYWESLDPATQKKLEPHKLNLKTIASEADAERTHMKGDLRNAG